MGAPGRAAAQHLQGFRLAKLAGAAALALVAVATTPLAADADAACPDDLCPTTDQIYGLLADSDGDKQIDSSLRRTRLTSNKVRISLVPMGAGQAPLWSFELPHRSEVVSDPPPVGDFTGDGIPDYVLASEGLADPPGRCGGFDNMWSALVFVDGSNGATWSPLGPLADKCWTFGPPVNVSYPTKTYFGFVQVGDFNTSYPGNEVVVMPAYAPDHRGWVLNFANGAWTRLTSPDGSTRLVHPSDPNFETYYNAANPGESCKHPFNLSTCHVNDSHVPIGLILKSRITHGLFSLTSGRALFYRPNLTPTSDTVWSSGNTPNAGRNKGYALYYTNGGHDYVSLIGGCPVQVARDSMKSGNPPTGRLDTSLGGVDAHCGIHHHYEWFEVQGTRIKGHVNRYFSYSVQDGFFHKRPEFPGNPIGPIDGPGTNWIAFNLYDGPRGSTGEGQWKLQLMPDPSDPDRVVEKPGWFVWAVEDLDGDGRAEVLATKAPSNGYVLPWEMDVMSWNGEDLVSIYHHDRVAPDLFTYPNTPTRYADGGRNRDGTITRDVSGDGVDEVMVENQGGDRAFLQVAPLSRHPAEQPGNPPSGGGGSTGGSTGGGATRAPLAFKTDTNVSLSLTYSAIGSGDKVSVTLRNANGFPVTGSVYAESVEVPSAGVKRKPLKLASKKFSLPAKGKARVKLTPSRKLRDRLDQESKLALLLRARVTDPAANVRAVKSKRTLKQKR